MPRTWVGDCWSEGMVVNDKVLLLLMINIWCKRKRAGAPYPWYVVRWPTNHEQLWEYRRLLCHSEKRASFFLTSLFLLLPFHTILRLSLFLWQWTHWLWLARRPLNEAEKDQITEGRHLLDLVPFKTCKAKATHKQDSFILTSKIK